MHTKYIIDVHAPNIEGKHDDLSDALVRMVWVAGQHMAMPKYIVGTHATAGGPSRMVDPRTRAAAARRGWAQARQLGTSPDRQRSRFSPGQVRGR